MPGALKIFSVSIALLAVGTPSFAVTTASLPRTPADNVRLKDLGRFLGWRDNALIGYGIVTGLAGSGDSPRSVVTRQALSNVLSRLGANVPGDQLQSRNVAAVMVTATLPPSANVGDRIDVTVTSIGDARSLVGGILLMTPLLGPDQKNYALAQGALVVGGYNFEDNVNLRQKNYPTTGIVAGGANVVCFTTGRGSAFGCTPVPSIKLATNSALYEHMNDDMDINAGRIIDGAATVEEVGAEIYQTVLAVASGQETKSESLDYGEEEFVPWHLGTVM